MNLAGKEGGRQFRAIASAWTQLRKQTAIGVIGDAEQYEAMVALMDRLIDAVGDNEEHELAGLLDVLGALVERYERDNVSIPEASPREILKFLMEQHDLRQVDLRGELGTQGVVSEILSGKRVLNARQAKALAGRFGVSPAIFL